MSVVRSTYRTKSCVVLLTAAGLVVTGCPQPTGPPPIAGTWSGTLTCESTQSLGSTTAPPQSSTTAFEITFDADGIPIAILILGFVEAPDQEASVARVGDAETQTAAAGALMVTQEVSVTSASFADTSVQVGIKIDYSATGGALTRSGTGTQTLSATATGDALDVVISTDYAVIQSSGVINLDTGEEIRCSGTLQRQ